MGWVSGRNRSIQHKSGRRVDCWGTYFGGNGLGRREKPIDSTQVRVPTLVALECTRDHGQRPRWLTRPSKHHGQRPSPATNTGCLSPDHYVTGALLNSCIWLKGCSRKPYPPHIHGNVLPPTVEPPASTPFRPPLPPWPTALQTFRHARVPPACTWLRSLPWLPREAIHHLPELPFALLRPRTNTPHGAGTGA